MTDTSINTFNETIRGTDWYQNWFAQKGLNPNMVKLNEKQRNELKALVEQNSGFKFPKDMKIDPAGNLNEKGGWAGLPTGVKIALIGAAAVGTAGLAGAFGGAAGVGAGGVGPGLSAAAGAPTAASTGMGLGIGGSAGALGTTGAASTVGTLGTVAKVASGLGKGGSTMDRIGELMRAGAGAVGAAGEASAQRRQGQNDDLLRARNQDISAESNFQGQQLDQAKMEAAQRDEARKALYRASVMKNPGASPENRSGAPTFSPEMLEGLTNLEKQALLRTADAPMYNTSQMRKPRDFTPLELAQNRGNSTMETISNWLAPGLKIGEIATRYF